MKLYCVIAFCVLSVATARSASSESETLQQAFVLVDLLKAEAKVRKGPFMKARGLRTSLTSTVEEPTCPTTQVNTNDDQYYTGPVVNGAGLPVPSRRLLNSFTPTYAKMRNQALKSRRLDYDDMFGPHPGGLPTESTPPTSQKTTSSSTVAATESQPASDVTTQLALTDTSRYKHIKTKTNSNKAVKLKMMHKEVSTSRDPVIEQVASEIMNEMKDKTSLKLNIHTAPLYTAKTVRSMRFDKFKGTYRIHQATSRRYSIPLPENNAFCFYHPDSALCRTFI